MLSHKVRGAKWMNVTEGAGGRARSRVQRSDGADIRFIALVFPGGFADHH